MNTRRIIAISLITTVMGCGASTDVDPGTLDATAVNARFAEMDEVLGSALWQSFAALGAVFAESPTGAALLERPTAPGAIAATPRIPTPLRGTTYVLATDPLRYVPDLTRTDAPATGVRIVLYAVNPITGVPVPDSEIGYADLTDEGDALPSGIALRLQIVSEHTTWVEYAVTMDGDEFSGNVGAMGFVSNPDARVEFDISASNLRTDTAVTMDLDFDIAVPVHEFWAVAAVRNVDAESGNTGAVDLDLTVGQTNIGFDAASTGKTVDAEVTVDNQLFATIAASGGGEPEVRDADGEALSQDEMRALGHIMSFNDTAFRVFGDLMRPVGPILGLEMLP